MHGTNTIVDPRAKTAQKDTSELTTMTSVSVRFEEMTVVGSRKGFYFKSLNLKKLLLLKTFK